MGEGRWERSCKVYDVVFLVEKQDKCISAPIYEGLDPVRTDVCGGVGAVRIYFGVECVKKCIIRPSSRGYLAHQVNDHGEKSEVALRIFFGKRRQAASGGDVGRWGEGAGEGGGGGVGGRGDSGAIRGEYRWE